MMTKQYTFCDDSISDLYKDAYGMRPGDGFWERWATATDAEKQEEWDWLVQVVQRNIEADKIDQGIAINFLEERIAALIECGARDRAMAIRWIDEAHETNGDLEFLAWNLGLPFNYFAKNGDTLVGKH